ncbi:hypothetical protein [Roseibium litorale]|uniref:Uncharacterized protein n=1 Tax=Roseibium litorale TaxID=2803841 RepID=A0ABR9CKD6_9HYPH|nr:hypothetical protein [Roseibium litorale]MBD8890875.1 hypothetical protein [Roseibium litorale]
MQTRENENRESKRRFFSRDVFFSSPEATHPAAGLQVAAIMSLAVGAIFVAGFMTLSPVGAADARTVNTVNKADRLERVETAAPCKGQAWGAWSSECAAQITGASSVRQVGFVTTSTASPTEPNTTVLHRMPIDG